MKRKNKIKKDVEFIHSGSHLLNLAASGKVKGAWGKTRIVNFVGDGSSGKTLLTLEACASAFYKESKDSKVIIVYNNIEGVMDLDLEEMYGTEFAKSIEWAHLETIEEAGRDYLRRLNSLQKGEYLIYALDSIDASSSAAARKRTDDAIKADKEEANSFGGERASYLSTSFFPKACAIMKKMEKEKDRDATLILISQVRTNLNAGMFGKKYYRIGGKSLDFYTHQVCWLYKIKNLTKTVKGIKRTYGVRVKAKLERNKLYKPFREAEFDIIFDYGIDDIESILRHLYGTAKIISWNGDKLKRKDLVDLLDSDKKQYKNMVKKLEENWNEIEEAIKPKRKRRFK